jgi:EAL domain-containing protein (putative c-di-GMP-specific phosphodiesterase class I)
MLRRSPDSDLSDFLPELCEHPDIDARRIVVEVMEQALSEHAGFARTLDYLSEMGGMIGAR